MNVYHQAQVVNESLSMTPISKYDNYSISQQRKRLGLTRDTMSINSSLERPKKLSKTAKTPETKKSKNTKEEVIRLGDQLNYLRT